MRFPEDAPVTVTKKEELRARLVALGIDLADVVEESVRGGGPGGQKINKTASAIRLTYLPLEITVRCQKTRSKATNRFLALRTLADSVDRARNPGTSRPDQQAARIRKQKDRRRRR